MNKDIKKRWVAALRSGKYKQGASCLKDHNGSFCCLGVLTELYLQEQGGSWKRRIPGMRATGFAPIFKAPVKETESIVLPKIVMKWAGLSNDNPFNVGAKNDKFEKRRHVWNFSKLADFIEKKL